MKRSIIVLSQFFYPDKLSTGKVLSELFFGLNPALFDIFVFSGRRLYQDSSNTVLPANEKFQNINIHRVSKTQFAKEKTWGRLFNYISFFFLACFQILFFKYQKTNLVFSVSNPPILPLLGAWLRSDQRKFVYLIHDLYPDIAIKLGVVSTKSVLSRVMFAINRYVFNKADAIIVLGRDMKEYLRTHYHIPASRIEVLPNWSKSLNIPRKIVVPDDKFRLLYTGNLGQFHDLEIAIHAAERLQDSLEVVFVGEGAKKEKLERIIRERNIRNVKFYGYLNQGDYETMLSGADALLLSLEKGLSGLAVPSKFYTYLAAGKPVVAIVDGDSEVALALCEENCGMVASHDDIDGFVGELSRLIGDLSLCEEMGNNALNAFTSKYEQSIVIKKYEVLFNKLCAESK